MRLLCSSHGDVAARTQGTVSVTYDWVSPPAAMSGQPLSVQIQIPGDSVTSYPWFSNKDGPFIDMSVSVVAIEYATLTSGQTGAERLCVWRDASLPWKEKKSDATYAHVRHPTRGSSCAAD